MGAGPPAASGFVASAPPVPSLAAGNGVPGCPEARRSAVAPSPAVLRCRARRKAASQRCPGVPPLRRGQSPGSGSPARSSAPSQTCPPTPRSRWLSLPPLLHRGPGGHPARCGTVVRQILRLAGANVPPPCSPAPPRAEGGHGPAPGAAVPSGIPAPEGDAGAWGLTWSGAARRVEDGDCQAWGSFWAQGG